MARPGGLAGARGRRRLGWLHHDRRAASSRPRRGPV